MAEPKTRPTGESVAKFLAAVRSERLRADAQVVLRMMEKATRVEPEMWGPTIVGFGRRRHVYADGKEADWPVCAFSPRSTGLVVYLGTAFKGRETLLRKLGKHRTGKSCLYLGPLDQVHLPTLRALIAASVKSTRARSKGR